MLKKAPLDIGLAQPDDLDAIVHIYNQAIAAGQRTGDVSAVTVEDRRVWLASHPPDRYPVLVAAVNGRTVGYLAISAYRPGRAALRYTAELSYYVDFEHHRQGVASALLQHAISLCLSLEIKTVFAIVLETNTASIRMLERRGFERWGHLPGVADFDGVEVGHVYLGLRLS